MCTGIWIRFGGFSNSLRPSFGKNTSASLKRTAWVAKILRKNQNKPSKNTMESDRRRKWFQKLAADFPKPAHVYVRLFFTLFWQFPRTNKSSGGRVSALRRSRRLHWTFHDGITKQCAAVFWQGDASQDFTAKQVEWCLWGSVSFLTKLQI